METYIAYFDETGDDGVTTASSEHFVLTSLYMSAESWQSNFDHIRECRRKLKNQFGFHVSEEFHTKHLLSDKDPYRKYGWTAEQRQEIVKEMIVGIAGLNAKVINVIIDRPSHPVWEGLFFFMCLVIKMHNVGNQITGLYEV